MNVIELPDQQRKPVSTFRSDVSPDTGGNTLIESDARNREYGGMAFDLDDSISKYVRNNGQISLVT